MIAKLNFVRALFLLLFVSILVSNCKDMKLDIQDSKDRLDVLEGTTITTINEQITAINTSISDLKEMDTALDEYIKTLEATAADLREQINEANAEIAKVESELGEEISALEQCLLNELNTAKEAIEVELSAINATLKELKAADAALDKKIEDLQAYVDSQLATTTNWANATFSTLTQYAETQTEIAAVKASIEQINASLAALETRLNGKIANDIKTAIEALRLELNSDHNARLESAVNNITVAYIAAVSAAKSELTIAYTNAISKAIDDSEKGMMSWVNEQLTQGYYDIAAVDGKLAALSTRLDEADDDLQGQINEQKSALETAKKELTSAYKTAINTAIAENNGIINAAIAEAIESLENKIQTRLSVVENQIVNIQRQLNNISNDISSIFEQIDNISSSISDLKDVDKEFDDVIGALKAKLTSLQEECESLKFADESMKIHIEEEMSEISALILALQSKDNDLQTSVSALQIYVDSELQNTSDWTVATFATLEQYVEVQSEISAIKTLVNEVKATLTDEYTVAIETTINNSEAAMKLWVNSQLAQGYYDIATIDGKLSALELLVTEGDSKLQTQINEQKEAVKQVKIDLTNEYKQYISQAITAGGIINQAIAAQVKTTQDNLQAQLDILNSETGSLKDRLGKLEDDFVSRIQSLKYLPEYSNHVAFISDVTKSFSVDFLVTPFKQAKQLAAEWGKGNAIIKAYVRYTNTPLTKAGIIVTPLLVSAVSATDDGLLSVVLQEDASSPLSKKFWTGENSAVMYLYVSDGNTELLSDLVDVEVYDELYDLSSYQTANCYIVSEAGNYKFTPTKGNSSDSVGSIASAEALWETFGTDVTPNVGDLIMNVKYEDGYISFETPSTYKEGNAVIAAKDENGTILWSWHIWLTDQPREQVYYYKAGTLMDRNLGATSATPGDVGALGLLYQWGRKDPFLSSSSIFEDILVKSTITWPSDVGSDSSTGTIEYTTANPTTYLDFVHVGSGDKDKNYDWYYTGSSLTDNTRWTNSVKSVYDPCPAGWRVPDGGENGLWGKLVGGYYTYDITNQGANLSGIFGSDSLIWYPAGWYWSASYYNFDVRGASILSISVDETSLYGYASTCRDYALFVRCQKE